MSSSWSQLFTSSLGKKYLVAITGIVLFFFVIGHLAGNLQMFLGREEINRYAHFLKSNPEILWPTRLALLGCIAIHLWATIALTLENQSARTQRYEAQQVVGASLASRTMIWSGSIIFAFVAYHLAHFTLLWTNAEYRNLRDAAGEPDVYRMVVMGFQQPLISAFYLLGVGLLCYHLSHGIGAMFQTLGLKNEVYRTRIDTGSRVFAAALFIGYASIPIAVLLGLGK